MNWIRHLGTYLFPPKCIFCRKVLEKDGVCEKCRAGLTMRQNNANLKPSGFIDACLAPLYYEGSVRSALLRYKFGGITAYATEFAKFMAECIEENLNGKYDIITWVPISAKRLRKRGYDQAQLLAEEIGKILKVKPVPLFKKVRNNPPQSRQSTKSARVANVIGAYEILQIDLHGKNILLIDDIATTSSTLSECARMLKTEGANKVYSVVLAKTRFLQKKN